MGGSVMEPSSGPGMPRPLCAAVVPTRTPRVGASIRTDMTHEHERPSDRPHGPPRGGYGHAPHDERDPAPDALRDRSHDASRDDARDDVRDHARDARHELTRRRPPAPGRWRDWQDVWPLAAHAREVTAAGLRWHVHRIGR